MKRISSALRILYFIPLFFGAALNAQTPGESCDNPIWVNNLPYNDSGNTSTYGSVYDENDVPAISPNIIAIGSGDAEFLNGDEVIYAYTPANDEFLTISTTNDDDRVALAVFTGCPYSLFEAFHADFSGTTREITNMPVTGGTTYYISISTWPAPQNTDYTIEIVNSEACSGTPIVGNILGPNTICASTEGYLQMETPIIEDGISYQWQVSTDVGVTWYDIPGAIQSTYTVISNDQGEASLRLIVTCDISTLSDTSNVFLLEVISGDGCACIPIGSENNSSEILNFALGSLDHNSSPNEGLNGYSDYAPTVAAAELIAGDSYIASLTSGMGDNTHGAAIWIDYNNNFIFEDFELVTFIDNTIHPNTTVDFPSFEVENIPGTHRLRVQYVQNQNGASLDPCAVSTVFSETEDYLIHVLCSDPVLDLGTDFAMCEGDTINLNAGNPGWNYEWNDGSSEQMLEITEAGIYIVTVSYGVCSSTDTVEVTIQEMPIVNLGTDINMCEGDTFILDAGNTGQGYTYIWNNNSSNQILEVNESGIYFVTVSAGYCSTSDTVEVVVQNLPIIDLGGNVSICEGETITLDAGNSGLTFLWSDNSTNQTLNVNEEGSYTVTVTEGVCSATESVIVNNIGAPTADAIFANEQQDCSFAFTVSNAVHVAHYTWDFGDGSPTKIGSTVNHTYNSNGIYTVTLEMTNDCEDTVTITQEVNCNSIDIKDIIADKNVIALYPNPTTNLVTIESDHHFTMEHVAVYNVLGQAIYQDRPMNSSKYTLDVSKMPSGVYTIHVQTNNGPIIRKFEIIK